jgi:hypothetical protein
MQRTLTAFLFIAMAGGATNAADIYGVAPAPLAPQGYAYETVPPCSEPRVLSRVAEKFAYYDTHVIHTGLIISQIDNIRETALKAGGPSYTDVRYCSATAWMSNGSTSDVAYIIEGPMKGTFSIGWNVESCLAGYDPWHTYDARCRAILP